MRGDNSWKEGATVVGVMMSTMMMVERSGGKGSNNEGGWVVVKMEIEM